MQRLGDSRRLWKAGTNARAHVDVTSLKELEADLESKNQELRDRNEELSAFAYSASHDLKSPVRNISGLIEFIKEDVENKDFEQLAKDLQHLDSAAEKLTQLIDGIMSLEKFRTIEILGQYS